MKKKHGMSNTRFYKIWGAMKYRTSHNHYGYENISVSERWMSFANFYNDMIDGYSDKLSLDRINVEADYCKENCRWATLTTQVRNTRVLRKGNSTGYKGVSLSKHTGKFRAGIRLSGVYKHLGYFTTPLKAAIMYDNYILDNNLEHTLNGVLL